MELRNIKSFVKVAELGNITQAAQALGYAQSTITTQIHQLEKELQVDLFNRNGKRLLLSSAGSDFLHYAYQMLRCETNVLNHFTHHNEPEGTLKIGVMETICFSKYSQIFRNFSIKHPGVALNIQIVTTHQALEALAKGVFDVIFLLDHQIKQHDFQIHKEYLTDISFFCATSHPLASQSAITLEALLRDPFILTEGGCNYRNDFENYLTQHNLSLRCSTEIGYTQYIIQAVSAGLGIGLLPEFTLYDALCTGQITLLPIADYHIQMSIQVIYSKKRPITPALYAFINT